MISFKVQLFVNNTVSKDEDTQPSKRRPKFWQNTGKTRKNKLTRVRLFEGHHLLRLKELTDSVYNYFE